MSVGIIVLGKDIIALIYERNNFGPDSTVITYQALAFYAVGMLGMGFQTILSRGFYAEKNGRVPLIASIIAIAVNLGLSYALVVPLSAAGPAFASSIAISLSAVIMFICMYRKNPKIAGKDMLVQVTKVLVTSAFMGVVVYFARFPLSGFLNGGFVQKSAALALLVLAGAISYFILAFILRIDETDTVRKIIKNRLFGKRGV